jgi:transcriptional regulator with XRE-family HTH domain
MAAALPHFGTSPSVEDLRPAVTVAAVPRSTDQGSSYRQILVQSFGHQAKEAMAALSLTKSQLAGVLRVSRPTVYEWLGGKEPSPGNADRLTTVLRLLARAGMSSEAPLNARFVRHAIHERSSSLIELLCADELDEAKIEDMLREVVALGQEARIAELRREERLRSLGYQEQSPEQRRDQLNRTVAMLDWPK